MSKTIYVDWEILKKPLHDDIITIDTLSTLKVPLTKNNCEAFQKCMKYRYSVENKLKYFHVQMQDKKTVPVLRIPLLRLAYISSLSHIGYRKDLVEELKAWSSIVDISIYHHANPFEKEYLEDLFSNTPGISVISDTEFRTTSSMDFTIHGTVYVDRSICDKDIPKDRVEMERFIEDFVWS